MKRYATLAEIERDVGGDAAVSDWIEITQQRINLFADATGDHQWIHVDPERAKAVDDVRMGVNYGLNKVRFTAPVPSGSRVRGHFKLLKFEHLEGGAQLTYEVRMEREGSDKPVCIAESVARRYT